MLVSTRTLTCSGESHLPLVSRRAAGSENTTFDTASSQVIQHGVVRHDQHTSIILMWCISIENAFAQKHWQTWRWWQCAGNFLRSLEILILGIAVIIQIEKKLRNFVRICRSRHVSDCFSRFLG